MTIAQQIGTTYFQLSQVGVGALAVGIEDIRQRIYNVVNTVPGSNPFRPLFGCNAYLYTDKPVTFAIPNIKKELFEALRLWMPEIRVSAITHTLEDYSNLTFTITYGLVDSDLIDAITLTLGGDLTGDTISNGVILSAMVPAKFTNGIYKIDFVVNGEAPYPLPPAQGWQSANEMYSWISSNWSHYGKWYLTATQLVLYVNTEVISKASLNVTEVTRLTLLAQVPSLAADVFYSLNFTHDGESPLPAFPVDTLNTVESLLAWVTHNWNTYGQWYILNNGAIITSGEFSYEFNPDFNVNTITEDIYLIFQSEQLNTATLTFN